jgi:hypothetical protein
LNSVDFPTLGRPTMPMVSATAGEASESRRKGLDPRRLLADNPERMSRTADLLVIVT